MEDVDAEDAEIELLNEQRQGNIEVLRGVDD